MMIEKKWLFWPILLETVVFLEEGGEREVIYGWRVQNWCAYWRRWWRYHYEGSWWRYSWRLMENNWACDWEGYVLCSIDVTYYWKLKIPIRRPELWLLLEDEEVTKWQWWYDVLLMEEWRRAFGRSDSHSSWKAEAVVSNGKKMKRKLKAESDDNWWRKAGGNPTWWHSVRGRELKNKLTTACSDGILPGKKAIKWHSSVKQWLMWRREEVTAFCEGVFLWWYHSMSDGWSTDYENMEYSGRL